MNKKTEKKLLGVIVFGSIFIGFAIAVGGALMVKSSGLLGGIATICIGLALAVFMLFVGLPKYIKINEEKIIPQKQWVKLTASKRFWRKAHLIALIFLIVAIIQWQAGADLKTILTVFVFGFIGGIMGIYVISLFIVPQAICLCGNIVNIDKESHCEKCKEKTPADMYE